ncbi:MAG: hypothetical protein Q8921_00725 [Bacteroidota bacterium]|nr:hypothetical protein [Bacteroidota bacterium]
MSSLASAQDTAWHPTIEFALSGVLLKHAPAYPPILNAKAIPAVIPEPYGQGPFGPTYYYNATDAPLYHGAQELDLFANGTILPGIHLLGDIIAEHRGSSYGVYSTKNIIVYPRITFALDTSILILANHFDFHITSGNFTNLRALNGLLLYNVDATGTIGHLGWHSLHLNYYHMGDMFEGIGLNANDAIDYTISMDDVPIPGGWRSRVEGGLFRYDNIWHKQTWDTRLLDTVIRGDTEEFILTHATPVPFVMGNTGWTLATGIANDSLHLYSEYRYRNPLSPVGTLVSKSALLAGASDHFKSERFSLQACAEYRYYGALFNDNYINEDVKYRSGGYGATIGPYLYPLTQFFRPFSQWAVFTEYQGRDVAGYNLQLDSKWFFYDRFALNTSLDLNLIKPAELSAIIYPFYNVGFSWEPAKNTGLFASATNREMNLDKHYPTLYLLKDPSLQLEVRFNFDQSRY